MLIIDVDNGIYLIFTKKITISKREGRSVMAKFIPKKHEKEVISMRISSEALEELSEKAAKIGISRNAFINQCISFALANMDNCDDYIGDKVDG